MRRSFMSVAGDQFRRLPAVANADLTGKTVMVVGANTGLGYEATKHYSTMNPARVIMACRSQKRGQDAVDKLKSETGYSADLRLVDIGDYKSVKAFVDGLTAEDARLDIVVLNAAMATMKYVQSPAGFEQTLQVNNLGTPYLSLLLLPLMHRAAERYGVTPRLCIVTSDIHYFGAVPEEAIAAPKILEKLSAKEFCTPAQMRDRYTVSKLLTIFFMRALAEHCPPTVIIVGPNPGFCKSDLRREIKGFLAKIMVLVEAILASTTEEGGRQLVWAGIGGNNEKSASEPNGKLSAEQLHGQYTSQSTVQEVSDYVLSAEGKNVQTRIWKETVDILTQEDKSIPEILETIKRKL